MSNTIINNTDLNIADISITSKSPADVSTTEDGITVHTYYTDAQRYEIDLKAYTTTTAEYFNLSAKLEVLGISDNFLFEIYSYSKESGEGYEFLGDITNNHYTQGSTAAGTYVVTYSSDSINAGNVAPNGTLAVGDFLQFSGASYPKTYRVTAKDTTNKTYTIFPSLRETIDDDTRILYNTDVKIVVRMTSDAFKTSQKGTQGQYRQYNIKLAEDYT